MADSRDPLCYRGIALAAVSYKLYCNILNDRLTQWVDDNNKLAEEQNGFRQQRSTIDQLSTLTNVIDVRKKLRKSTYCAFIDFKKAYDTINRDILWSKLSKIGVAENFCTAIKSIYRNVLCSVRINGHFTDWFDVNSGLKQGCPLSPVLFNLYVNDLVTFLKSFDCGIDIGNDKLCILLYADDVVIIANDDKELQILLNALGTWCEDNCTTINAAKSNVVHFRPPSISRSDTVFKCNDNIIEYSSNYTYLGLVLNEHLDYNVTAKAVAASANRALGLVIAKCKILGGVCYDVFVKLYESLVCPIVEYGASIWGTRKYTCINAIQNRACRFFLGVGKYTPNVAVTAEMGLIPIFNKQWKSVIRLWCRFNNMSSNRLNRKVFKWADIMSSKHKCVKNWNFIVKKTFCELNLSHFCSISDCVDTDFVVKSVMSKFFENHIVHWNSSLHSDGSKSGRGGNKLRTYRLFKHRFEPEQYCKIPLPFNYRSAFAKFRCGVAPLRIETGRYENIKLVDRVCSICKDCIEDEAHVLLKCPLYDDFRNELFLNAESFNENFMLLDDTQKLVFLFSDGNMIRLCAKTCYLILNMRRNVLYCK